ncbi:hypothetical protein AU468_09810 [Alkalispirochaeta sphaeroplastigenens]|uniref:Methyltransferase domain-containing protein n=1 Tax=Alkalispirochaeta sphaeroplastigenens TaxID=1187066 RepID=A0A2S4JL96_9SPIO|nr:hypothetical protein AU468_09810 [Alkalispirochaeta sphaeroplastigenens]
MIGLIDPSPDDTILELCCGTGSVSLRLAKIVRKRIRASDLSSDQIRIARSKAGILRRNVEFSVQDASDTEYDDACSDKIVISGALHEIRVDRRIAIYREVRRLLKKDGHFFVSEPDMSERGWGKESFEFMFGRWNPEYVTAYELIHDGIQREVEEAGFRQESSCASNFGVFRSRRFVRTGWPRFVYTPAQTGHSFRRKADGDSGVIRTLIPAESGQFFRSSGINSA